jgi:hypothetical protein
VITVVSTSAMDNNVQPWGEMFLSQGARLLIQNWCLLLQIQGIELQFILPSLVKAHSLSEVFGATSGIAI